MYIYMYIYMNRFNYVNHVNHVIHPNLYHTCKNNYVNDNSMYESLSLSGALEHVLFFHSVGNVIIPTDFDIFQRGRYTTNQMICQ